MKGDFTRLTFRSAKRYAGVRMQQGRVQTDADWNEQADILTHHRETALADQIGRCGAPKEGGGFRVGVSEDGDDLTLSPGRIYVNGILCEAFDDGLTYGSQPDFPSAPAPGEITEDDPGSGPYLVYLDVWRRHLTALQDPEIREVALGGPDTTTRVQTVRQVKLFPLAGEDEVEPSCTGPLPAWEAAIEPPSGRMRARTRPPEDPEGPCVVPAAAGYTRLENQLYRVEVHDPGELDGAATFKWSRENGSVVSEWLGPDEPSHEIAVRTTGRDETLGIRGNHWVELTDDTRELAGEPGLLVRVAEVRGSTLVLDGDGPQADRSQFPRNPIVRRWDMGGDGGALAIEQPGANDGYLPLEAGIEVRFEAGSYRTGDYWLIPARAFIGEFAGDIEWPREAPDQGVALPPDGIEHHYCRLARVELGEDETFASEVPDCRPRFLPLTRQTRLAYGGGDGQQGLPGSELPCPLRVTVAQGDCPIGGARVRFTVRASDGTLRGPSGPPGQSVVVSTSEGGVARCFWTLPDEPPVDANGQRRCLLVRATLLDDLDQPAGEPPQHLRFDAEVATASQVAYDPSACPDLEEAGADTVQEAIDELCRRAPEEEPGIGIRAVLTSDLQEVDWEADLGVERFARGLVVVCDQPIAREAFEQEAEGVGIPARSNCEVHLDVPFPLTRGEIEFWDQSAPVGFHPILLASRVEADDQRIVWRPRSSTVRWLRERLFQRLQRPDFETIDRLRVRLTLKGHFIWLEGSGSEPDIYLDGDAFGRPIDGGRVGGRLPSGDGRRGGDFEMWFYLTPGEGQDLVLRLSLTGRTLFGTVVDADGGAVPGANVTATTQAGQVFFRATGADGRFAFANLEPGRYTIRAELGGLSASQIVIISAGFTDIRGVGEIFARRLEKAGMKGPADVAALEPERLAEILDASETRAERIRDAARELAGED